MGALIAVLARGSGGLLRVRSTARAAFLIAIALLALGSTPPPAMLRYAATYSIVTALWGSALVLILVSPAMRVTRWLSVRWLAGIGTISYAMYVFHYPIAQWARHLGAPVASLLTLTLTVAMAVASWFLLERPFLRLKSRWPMPAASNRNENAPTFVSL